MVEGTIPSDVQQFILINIDSIAHLEALLIFHQHSGRSWSASQIAERLYINEDQTTLLLRRLSELRFITAQEGEFVEYVYQPESVQLGEMISRMAEIYVKHLVPVTNLVHSKAHLRIQQFADAFKLRRDE